MTNEDQNLEEIVGDSNIVERPIYDDSPKWFKYAARGILVATQITYFLGVSYEITKSLERNPDGLVGYALPLLSMATVAGAFLIRDGYSRAVNSLASCLYSDRIAPS